MSPICRNAAALSQPDETARQLNDLCAPSFCGAGAGADKEGSQGGFISLCINDEAPYFKARTIRGEIDFHEWIVDSWAILFSHPGDFTPGCTTELGYMSRLEPEFKNTQLQDHRLSVDAVDNHDKWAKDIEEAQGAKGNYPMIGDDVILVPAFSGDEVRKMFPTGWKTLNPYFFVGHAACAMSISYGVRDGLGFVTSHRRSLLPHV